MAVFPSLPDLLTGLRRALRRSARSPLTTILVVAVLAVGFGATAALWTVVRTVLLAPLPYERPEELVRIYETFPFPGGQGQGSVSVPNLRDWQAGARELEGLAAFSVESRNLQGVRVEDRALAGDLAPERLSAGAVSEELFGLLGVDAAQGRGLVPEDHAPGAPPVVVVSPALWQRRSGGAPPDEAVGARLILDGEAHTVVGVMPPAFEFPPGSEQDLWLPLEITPVQESSRGSHWMGVVARLAREDGEAAEDALTAARTELETIAARLAETEPEQEGRSVLLVDLRESVVGGVRPALLMLLAGTALVFLVALANAAGLVLVRSAARRREVAVRTALGAGRWQLIGQFAAEAALLVGGAAILGTALAWASLEAFGALMADEIPRGADIALDLRLVGAVVVLGALVTLGLGLLPALQAASGRSFAGAGGLHGVLSGGGGRGASLGRGGRRFQGALVAGQVAVAVVLLVGAGLLLRTFWALLDNELGFDPEQVLTLSVSLPAPGEGEAPLEQAFYEPVRQAVAGLPGVSEAGWTSHLPLREWGMNGNFGIVGRPAPASSEEAPFSEFRLVSPGYFSTLGIPVLQGRVFTDRDLAAEGMVGVVVNRTLAEAYFPEGDPLAGRLQALGQELPILGVVGDVRGATLDRDPMAEIYFPYNTSFLPVLPALNLVARTEVAPESAVESVRRAVRQVDPGQPVYRVSTMDEVVGRSVADRKLYLALLGLFAGFALVLTVAGIYGAVAAAVAQRERELGIRLALGARPGEVMGMLLRQAARVAALGLAIGLAAAWGAGRFLESQLYGVSALDAATFAAVALLIAGMALAAAYVPARRVLGIDPMVALEEE